MGIFLSRPNHKEDITMSEENIYTFENEAYRKTYWHTCSHILPRP